MTFSNVPGRCQARPELSSPRRADTGLAAAPGRAQTLRLMNESAALELLLSRGPLSRAELHRATGMSKPTASAVIQRLVDAGTVVSIGAKSTSRGPRPKVYAINPAAAYVLAIRVTPAGDGPPQYTATLADVTSAVVQHRHYPSGGWHDATPGWWAMHRSTSTWRPKRGDAVPDDTADQLMAIASDMFDRAGLSPKQLTHVQLATPGIHDPVMDTLTGTSLPGWDGAGLTGRCAQRLGATVVVANDLHLAALAEIHHGAAVAGYPFALLRLDEQPALAVTDASGASVGGIKQDLGQLLVESPEPERPPARLHDTLGGPAVVALAAECGIADGSADPTAATVIRGAVGLPQLPYTGFLSRLAGRIAYAVRGLLDLLDVPLVVLSGELIEAGGPVLRDAITRAIDRDATITARVHLSVLGPRAALRGALDLGLHTVRRALIDRMP